MVAPERASRTGLLHAVDELRRAVSASLDDGQQASLGQYFTPAPIARFMASLFPPQPDVACLRLLDAGAGIGMLTAAWVEAVCSWPRPPAAVHVTLYEVDAGLIPTLQQTLRLCRQACADVGLAFSADVRQRDFVQSPYSSRTLCPRRHYFRTWSGSTQVNAGDLRYPQADVLAALGTQIGQEMPAQGELDQLMETELLGE